MSRSLSERANTVIKLPKNIGEKYNKDERTGSWVESGEDAYREDVRDRAWKVIGDTLSQYEYYKKNPGASLSLFGGYTKVPLGPAGEKLIDLTKISKTLGYDILEGSPEGVVKLPPHFSEEDKALLKWAIDTVKDRGGQALGGRPRPNYGVLFASKTNSGVLNDAVHKLTGDALKKEFEKGRIPFKLPKSKEYEKYYKIYESKDKPPKKPKSILGSIKDAVIKQMTGPLDTVGTDGHEILYGTAKVDDGSDYWKRVQHDYFSFNDPYQSTTEQFGHRSFDKAIDDLKKRNLLSSYRDFAGFEMGSDHLWKINLYPYPYGEEEAAFKALGRKSVVPPLPCYALPNMWKEVKEVSSVNPKSPDIVESATIKTAKMIVSKLLDVDERSIDESQMVSSLEDSVIFSYSHNTPVISYDLTLGSMKSDTMRLFNGSSVEIFAGMNYSAVMTLSILDDVYGSMRKYMNAYVNAVYDINTHSMAPYYACAFQIELVILRPGGQINYKHKFIGVPFEYTPRFDGSNDANETRIDISFGIIGYITPKSGLDREVYVDDMGGRARDKTEKGKEKKWSLGKMSWGDINLNMGQHVKD